jgi:hypothetical protein
MSELSGRPHSVWAETAIGHDTRDWAEVWTIATDTLARVSVAAAAATAEAQLQAETASALAGPFADWAFVDILGRQWERAVAARLPDPGLAGQLLAVTAPECSLIRSVMQRGTQVVTPVTGDDESLLGRLPGGRTVLGAIGACSAAAAPIMNGPTAHGVITIVRGAGRPGISFVELGVLTQIGELTNAAVERLALSARPARRPPRAW